MENSRTNTEKDIKELIATMKNLEMLMKDERKRIKKGEEPSAIILKELKNAERIFCHIVVIWYSEKLKIKDEFEKGKINKEEKEKLEKSKRKMLKVEQAEGYEKIINKYAEELRVTDQIEKIQFEILEEIKKKKIQQQPQGQQSQQAPKQQPQGRQSQQASKQQPQGQQPQGQQPQQAPIQQPKTIEKNIVKILVGGKNGVQVTFWGKEDRFNQQITSRMLRRNVGKLNFDDKISYIEKLMGPLNQNFEKEIRNNLNFLDDSVLIALNIAYEQHKYNDVQKEALKLAMKLYVEGTINKKIGSGLCVEYDKSDISKINIPIISRLRGRMSRKQKDYLNSMAERTENWTEHNGDYERSPIKRYLGNLEEEQEDGELETISAGERIFKRNICYDGPIQIENDRKSNRTTHKFSRSRGGLGR